MSDLVQRLRRAAQNEQTAIGLAELLRLEKAECERLRARVAESEKDTRRLNWLEASAKDDNYEIAELLRAQFELTNGDVRASIDTCMLAAAPAQTKGGEG